MRIAVLNGPNLNLLGRREPGVYGTTTFTQLEAMVQAEAARLGVQLEWFQSNHEGALVDRIQALAGTADGLVLNAAAYTHTSIAIRDALLAVALPFIEVHLSDPQSREAFRHHSFTADLALQVIAGHGPEGYLQALRALHGRLAGE